MSNVKASTQDHLDIHDVKNDVAILKNGGVVAVIQTTAVNFDLLSEIEQDAIIAAFSMLLNSITFPIQISIRSKKLDISKYIDKVQRVENQITDPLLKQQAHAYRKFVQETITQNEVLDKSFYIVVPSGGSFFKGNPSVNPFGWITKMFAGSGKKVHINVDRVIKDAQPELEPKVDHLIKEFTRIGMRTKKLTTQELVELYFDIYNPISIHGQRIRTSVQDYKTAIVSPAILEE